MSTLYLYGVFFSCCFFFDMMIYIDQGSGVTPGCEQPHQATTSNSLRAVGVLTTSGCVGYIQQ